MGKFRQNVNAAAAAQQANAQMVVTNRTRLQVHFIYSMTLYSMHISRAKSSIHEAATSMPSSMCMQD